jgi:UDP-glucose 4-epimerase
MTSVLVTGGDGYVGSQCAIALMDAGYDVAVLDNHSTGFKSIGDALSAIPSDGSFLGTVQGDLLDLAEVDSALERWDVDAVMHFAAFSQVAESVSNPSKYYRNNVIGTMNLLDSMRSHDVDMIVYSSSAAVYGEPKYLPIDESHPREPISPYGRTKLCVEHMMDDYDLAYGIRSVRLRYFNVAGADSRCRVGECHDPETHLIPSILRSTFNGRETFQIFGADYGTRDGTCIRDYVNVEDLADAHVLALKYLENGGRTDFFNLGTNEGSTVREVFSTCERITGRSIPLEMGDRRPGDPASLVADNKKAKAILGWNPIRTLEDSIRTAYAWEKKKREP